MIAGEFSGRVRVNIAHVLRNFALVVVTGVFLATPAIADHAGKVDSATPAAPPAGAAGATTTLSLALAVFPIPGETRAEPHFAEGRFGAFRPGRQKRRDCGRGHCGIDLCAAVGAPVIATKDGVIAQIDQSTSGEGGRWIRIQHEDGTSTWYMHLARVREGLATGDSVNAGDKIATLGRTGVTTSPTHLHFAVTVGRPGHEKHLDPTGLLETAALVPAPTSPLSAEPQVAPPVKVRRSQRPEF